MRTITRNDKILRTLGWQYGTTPDDMATIVERLAQEGLIDCWQLAWDEEEHRIAIEIWSTEECDWWTLKEGTIFDFDGVNPYKKRKIADVDRYSKQSGRVDVLRNREQIAWVYDPENLKDLKMLSTTHTVSIRNHRIKLGERLIDDLWVVSCPRGGYKYYSKKETTLEEIAEEWHGVLV